MQSKKNANRCEESQNDLVIMDYGRQGRKGAQIRIPNESGRWMSEGRRRHTTAVMIIGLIPKENIHNYELIRERKRRPEAKNSS